MLQRLLRFAIRLQLRFVAWQVGFLAAPSELLVIPTVAEGPLGPDLKPILTRVVMTRRRSAH